MRLKKKIIYLRLKYNNKKILNTGIIKKKIKIILLKSKFKI